MSTDGHGIKEDRNIAENFSRLSTVHERYRQTTDRRQTDGRWHSEREREFTFAKNLAYSRSPLFLFATALSGFRFGV